MSMSYQYSGTRGPIIFMAHFIGGFAHGMDKRIRAPVERQKFMVPIHDRVGDLVNDDATVVELRVHHYRIVKICRVPPALLDEASIAVEYCIYEYIEETVS